MLLLAMAIELGALALRNAPEKQRSWRQVALMLLGVSFVTSLPALLTGYLAGRTFARYPAEFQNHWISAVIATVTTGLVFLWRLGTRDKLTVVSRAFSVALIVVGAAAVGWTGHLGGEMVFGEDEPVAVAAAPTPAPAVDERGQRLEQAAGRMEMAASKLDLATERMAHQAEMAKQPAAPTPMPRVARPLPPAAVPSPPVAPGESATDRAADRLAKVADQFTSISERLERSAQRLEAAQKPGAAPATVPTAKPGTPVVATPTTPPKPAGPDPKLVALGEKFYFDSNVGGCDSCHKLNGKGGRGGPDLTGVGSRQPSIDWQKAHLIDPPSKVPGSKMPAYNDLTDEQLTALAHFVVSQK
jgi:mono/diheme cytochrome c family protein